MPLHDGVFRDWFLMPFPPGSIRQMSPLAPWNQDGFRANLQTKESKTIGEVVATFDDFSRHRLLVGVTAQYHRLYDYRQVGNFDACPPGAPIPGPCYLPEDRDVTETWPSLANVDRELFAAFAEDLWDVTDDLRLSLGARYDHYSDFGDSFNPRLGATWAARTMLDLRAHYGTAFRAPTFINLGSMNNPGNVGNPDLGPEEVRTFEVGVDAFPSDHASVHVTGFFNRLENLIATDQTTSRFENAASGDAQGVETEVRLRKAGHSLRANYTYTDVEENAARFGSVPSHRGNLVGDLGLREWNLNLHLYAQGKTRRETADSRPEIPSYALLDATLTTPTLFGHAVLQLRGANLLDEEYRDPSPGRRRAGRLPDAASQLPARDHPRDLTRSRSRTVAATSSGSTPPSRSHVLGSPGNVAHSTPRGKHHVRGVADRPPESGRARRERQNRDTVGTPSPAARCMVPVLAETKAVRWESVPITSRIVWRPVRSRIRSDPTSRSGRATASSPGPPVTTTTTSSSVSSVRASSA